MATVDEIRDILQQSEQDAFGLSEWGGNAEEIQTIRDNAIQKVYVLLGIKRICYGCGAFIDECKCGLSIATKAAA